MSIYIVNNIELFVGSNEFHPNIFSELNWGAPQAKWIRSYKDAAQHYSWHRTREMRIRHPKRPSYTISERAFRRTRFLGCRCEQFLISKCKHNKKKSKLIVRNHDFTLNNCEVPVCHRIYKKKHARQKAELCSLQILKYKCQYLRRHAPIKQMNKAETLKDAETK